MHQSALCGKRFNSLVEAYSPQLLIILFATYEPYGFGEQVGAFESRKPARNDRRLV